MSDYTPTTEDVRHAYVSARSEEEFAASYLSQFEPEFDRWLAAHDAEVRAQALREAADVLDRQPAKAKHGLPMMLRADWLRDRANRIEQGGQP